MFSEQSASAMKPNVIFILGPPGSGKGTQSSNIVKYFQFAHLSAGDLLREELNVANSTHRDIIKKHIDAGTIVPVEITCALIKKRMTEIMSTGIRNFLIDGFPRNWDNVHGWESTMSETVNLLFVLYLDADEETCVERCLLRNDGSGRTDDNVGCLKRRFDTFVNDTMPIINYFMQKGVVQKVNSTKTPTEVFEDIKLLIGSSDSTDSLIPNLVAFSP